MIGMQDADGVAMAAIQGLNAKVEQALRDRDRLIQSQRSELAVQRSELAELRRMLEEALARVAVDVRFVQAR
jgi:hypothetical protein